MTQLIHIPLDHIDPSPLNPRQHFDEATLESLASSIKRVGVLQPILVRAHAEPGRYELIAGERRWRASRIAERQEIPAIVLELDEAEVQESRLVENLEREALNPIDEGLALRALMDFLKCSESALAQRLGRSPQYVRTRTELLNLDQRVQNLVINGELYLGTAFKLSTLLNGEDQFTFAQQVVTEGLTAAETEKRIQQHNLNLRLAQQQVARRLKLERRAQEMSTNGTVISFQEYDPARHHRSWDLIFANCESCERKIKFLRADGATEDLCTDPDCYRTLRDSQQTVHEQSLRRLLQERRNAFSQVLDSDDLKPEHLKYVLWTIVNLMGPTSQAWQSEVGIDASVPSSKERIWSAIAAWSDEQVLTQTLRLVVAHLAAQENPQLPTELRRSLMRRFGIPSSILFESQELNQHEARRAATGS